MALATMVLHIGHGTAEATITLEHPWQVHMWPQGWSSTTASAAQHNIHSAALIMLADNVSDLASAMLAAACPACPGTGFLQLLCADAVAVSC